MFFLAVETSCDETAAAVFTDEPIVLSNVIASQTDLHARFGGVVVHNTPGLVGALLVGVSAAKMLAVALGVPLLGVNHVEGHVYACRLAAGRDIFPCVGLVVSGGHTILYHCRSALHFERLGA